VAVGVGAFGDLRELVEDLRPGREIAYTTVMDNLHRKGCLTRERDVRAGACPVPAELFAARHVKEVMSGCAAR
jgi:predicted transcriptional regulator